MLLAVRTSTIAALGLVAPTEVEVATQRGSTRALAGHRARLKDGAFPMGTKAKVRDAAGKATAGESGAAATDTSTSRRSDKDSGNESSDADTGDNGSSFGSVSIVGTYRR